MFDDAELNWLNFLVQLKATGMIIAEMVKYSGLRNQGSCTFEARTEMLVKQQQKVVKQQKLLNECSNLLDDKISLYRNLILKRDEDDKTRKSSKNTRCYQP